jgi:DNA-binding response OmpR family regulator
MAPDNINVTYVEDEPAIAELLRSGLGLFGITVNPIYGTAEEAQDQILNGQAAHADVLIFDIRLPGMTGLELAQSLRQAGETRPFLIVSAYQPPKSAELKELGASFMPKPFDFAGIVGAIQSLLG